MGREIERKFLVKRELLDLSAFPSQHIDQGYLSDDPVVRIRIIHDISGDKDPSAKLTIKGSGTLSREEFEYDVPVRDALSIMLLCEHRLTKRRYFVHDGWIVDVFPRLGLIMAEIELKSEHEDFDRPDWLGLEVTEDTQYANVNLAKKQQV